jgi:hypothetical protein
VKRIRRSQLAMVYAAALPIDEGLEYGLAPELGFQLRQRSDGFGLSQFCLTLNVGTSTLVDRVELSDPVESELRIGMIAA